MFLEDPVGTLTREMERMVIQAEEFGEMYDPGEMYEAEGDAARQLRELELCGSYRARYYQLDEIHVLTVLCCL